jgi:hypothetical protein
LRRANVSPLAAIGVTCVATVLSACAREVICPASAGAVTASALTNATSQASYLELEPWEEAAIVAVTVRRQEQAGPALCSGVLVGSGRVLTAAHCVRDTMTADILVELVSREAPLWEAQPVSLALHPTLDLAVLEIEALPTAIAAGSIPPAASPLPGLVERADVQLAGFGADEHGQIGSRRFNVEAIETLYSDRMLVSAQGMAGACEGDSGGPALMRGPDGHVVVVGILSAGSVTCFGTDTYVRVDAATVWLAEQVPPAPRLVPQGIARTALGTKGKCFANMAVWLDQGAIKADACATDLACGWDGPAQGFRCLAPAHDACGGISELGSCQGGTSIRCLDGEVAENPCGACGLECGRSPRTGAFVCFTN